MSELINTRETSGEFDPLTRLAEDEPYFALVGRDRLAPTLVQQWAEENRRRALDEFRDGKIDQEKRDRELRKSTQAEALGWAMVEWKAGDMAKKVKSEPTGKSYTGAEVPEETKRRDAIHTARLAAFGALNNAVSECSDLVMFLTNNSVEDDLRRTLWRQIEALKELADEVNPSRVIGVAA